MTADEVLRLILRESAWVDLYRDGEGEPCLTLNDTVRLTEDQFAFVERLLNEERGS